MNARVCYLFSLLFLAGGAWFVYSAASDPRDGAVRTAELKKDIQKHRDQNARLALEIEEMRVLLKETKANPARMEELARRRLQLIKPGEVFILPSDGN
ncbi:MAG: septum formation initiator family protein [Betaproteobacteria bacterium]|nr:septum formation initiator family protein [Betaproteobacteria bacterium]